MSEGDPKRELERQLELASRLARAAPDPTTYERIVAFAEEVRYRLRRLTRRTTAEDDIRIRARALWEGAGRPAGRDIEFWLQAERELKDEDVRAD
ncbi:DUF2934 domain-containing protein [Bradyrhizobium sp. Arg68]|uniref:DUF2934 domain-containing protein n=1 Tax=Bradyrhizobium ivorense TaxID=2511166 RepID=UPI001E5AA96F|nr:DUF2934 domain-containing protein [Bradyrhizobium ivorense]MCC8942819.1 DUF2934 domain-containing protein [Bradyrhizobium ivorense]